MGAVEKNRYFRGNEVAPPMRHALTLTLILSALLTGCCRTEKEIAAIHFPQPPVEILSNEDVGMDVINYFNIVPRPEGGYRLYFAGYTESVNGPEFDHQDLFYADSEDGFHYSFKGKIMDGVVEQSVFLTGEKETPYGLVGRVFENGRLNLFLWKSKDGIAFDGKTLLLIKWHDTQNAMVPRDGKLKLYTRIWADGWTNRKIAVAEYSPEGERLTGITPLAGDFLYNAAPCPVDERHDVLFPTYFNNKYPAGSTDTCFFKCFVADGLYTREIPCNLNDWMAPDEKWMLASPGFVTIGGERYLAYNTRNASHDAPYKGMVSRYKLIKAEVLYDSARHEELRVQRIWDQGYSAFPSIVRYKDAWFVSFREGESHIFDENGIAAGKTRILRSTDGKRWKSVALLSKEGYDLRDPKLSVTADGRLMVVQGGSVYVDKQLVKRTPQVSFSTDGRSFSDPEAVDYPIPGGFAWFWRMTWHEGTGYTVNYGEADENKLELLKTTDGRHFEKITDLALDGFPNETTVRFLPDGRMAMLVRREKEDRMAYLGVSGPPFTQWTFRPLRFQIGGPEMAVLPDGSLLVGGRAYFESGETKTCLWKGNAEGDFELWKILPSGGDNSYPGFWVEEDGVTVVYYSSHELTRPDGRPRAGIYLARMPLP
jgi:hypothetical protein